MDACGADDGASSGRREGGSSYSGKYSGGKEASAPIDIPKRKTPEKVVKAKPKVRHRRSGNIQLGRPTREAEPLRILETAVGLNWSASRRTSAGVSLITEGLGGIRLSPAGKVENRGSAGQLQPGDIENTSLARGSPVSGLLVESAPLLSKFEDDLQATPADPAVPGQSGVGHPRKAPGSWVEQQSPSALRSAGMPTHKKSRSPRLLFDTRRPPGESTEHLSVTRVEPSHAEKFASDFSSALRIPLPDSPIDHCQHFEHSSTDTIPGTGRPDFRPNLEDYFCWENLRQTPPPAYFSGSPRNGSVYKPAPASLPLPRDLASTPSPTSSNSSSRFFNLSPHKPTGESPRKAIARDVPRSSLTYSSESLLAPAKPPLMKPDSSSSSKSNTHGNTPFDTQPMSSARTAPTLVGSRAPAQNLQLPNFPRFHPAVYQATKSSKTSSPSQPRRLNPLPPRSPSRHQGSPAQQQLYQYQQNIVAATSGSLNTPGTGEVPKSPTLVPCVSPGPATPLDLEGQGDYLTAGMMSDSNQREYVDKLIREEKARRGAGMENPVSPALSP